MTVLEIGRQVGIGDSRLRRPEAASETPWTVPEGTHIVSSDSHWLEPPDMWQRAFPAHLQARAPRMFLENGAWHMEVDGKLFIGAAQAAGFATFESVPGMASVPERLADLDVEGVHQEVMFPQRSLALIRVPDLEYREWCFRSWNLHMAEVNRENPRLHGVGIMNWWEPERADEWVAELKELGFKAVMSPIQPGKFPDDSDINYQDPRMDPFWKAIEESGLPLCFHIGEDVKIGGQGVAGLFVLTQTGGFRNLWGALTFGGVFDRFPRLRVVFVEGGLSWVPSALHDADMIYESFQSMVFPKLEHSPSHYWKHNCAATFMTDPAGLELIHRIGVENALWCSDYPHPESTLGYTRSALQAVFDSVVDPADAQKIVGGNALRVFGLEPLAG